MAARLSGSWRLDIAVARMNWLPLKLAGPFWPLGRSQIEMRYLRDLPYMPDGQPFRRLLTELELTYKDVASTAPTQPVLG